MEYLRGDVTARAYRGGFDDHVRGASREDGRERRLRVDYVKEVTAIGENEQAELGYGLRRERAGEPRRTLRGVPVAADASQPEHDAAPRNLGRRAIDPAAVGNRRRDTGPNLRTGGVGPRFATSMRNAGKTNGRNDEAAGRIDDPQTRVRTLRAPDRPGRDGPRRTSAAP